MKKQRNMFLTFVGSLIIFVIGVGLVRVARGASYPDTKQPMQQIAKYSHDGESFVIIFHKSGCSDCEQVQPFVLNKLKSGKLQRFVVIDLAKSENRHFIQDYSLIQTPTFLRIKGSLVQKDYHGTNKNEIAEVLSNGKNW